MSAKVTPIFSADSATRPAGSQKPTQTSQAMAQIREDILSGLMAPGERLIVANLAARLRSSQTPIREALMRLASEGLVVLEDQRGFSVAALTREDLVQLTEARVSIECLVLRMSIERGDDEWEGRLLGSLHRLKKATITALKSGEISQAWEQQHEHFHAMLVSACGNSVLLEFREALFIRGTRYRRLAVRNLETLRENLAYHEEIVDAALDYNIELAEKLMADHVSKVALGLLDDE